MTSVDTLSCCSVIIVDANNPVPLHKLCSSPTLWNTVPLEKLAGSQLVKKFSALYGTWRLINAFISARLLYLCLPRSVQYMPPPPPAHAVCWWSVLILSSHSRLGPPVVSFPRVSPSKPCMNLYPTFYMPRPFNSSWFDNPNNIWWGMQIIQLLVM